MNLPVNQILQGDCIEMMNALPEKCVDMVFADPPYFMQLTGDLYRPNMTRVDAVNDAWDKFDSFAAYDAFTRDWLSAARRVLKDTGTLWVIGSYHNIYRVGANLMDLGYWILNDVVWIKHNPLPQMKGVRLCNAHETLLWAKKSQGQRTYTFHYRELKAGNEDKQLRSDWYFPICSRGERERVNGVKAHTTQKPEALLQRILLSTSNPGDLILDPFCGTGTTAAVAKRLGRNFITIDREQEYVCVARNRVDQIIPALSQEGVALVDAPKPRVSFASLVEAGWLHAGQELRLGKTGITATVQSGGTITANGLRGSIHKIGAQCLGLPSCNGWTHWQYLDSETDEWRLIDDLRTKRLLSQEVTDGEPPKP